MTTEEKIKKLLKDKHTITSAEGVVSYVAITTDDIQKIISTVVLDVADSIKSTVDGGGDEWESLSLLDSKIEELKNEYSEQTKKPKMK